MRLAVMRGSAGRFFRYVFFGYNILMVWWLLDYWARVGGSLHAGSHAAQVGAAIGTTLGTGFILFIWLAGAVITGLLALFTRGPRIEKASALGIPEKPLKIPEKPLNQWPHQHGLERPIDERRNQFGQARPTGEARNQFGERRKDFSRVKLVAFQSTSPRWSWSAVLFWVALGFCGLIFLGAISDIMDPEAARARREAQAVEHVEHKETAALKGANAQQPATWPGCQVTMANFLKLEAGMDYRRVRNILNCDGEEISRTEISGIPTTVMYQWNADRGFGNMNATFQGDRLTMKAQFGLE